MRIYFDACCLNRPFDDQSQDRPRLESEAVLLILARIAASDWQWFSSEVVEIELEQMPDEERKYRALHIASSSNERITVGEHEVNRSKQLQQLSFQTFDSLHLACAESGTADVFLTTDDRLTRLAKRVGSQIAVRVANPLSWLTEVLST